jgi:SAM-dependent methyltransferase
MSDDHILLIRSQVLDQDTFIRATFGGRQRRSDLVWKRVVLRPVAIKGQRHIQFSYLDERKDITKNYAGLHAEHKLDELLTLAFKNVHLQTTEGDIQIQITKKGKAIIRRHPVSGGRALPSLQHDRQKRNPLPDNRPDPFLQAIGIMTQGGKVRASKRKKYQQINQFLKLVVETGALEKTDGAPLSVVDCGCGNAYLTFAVYHYLNHVLGLPTRVVGVDVQEELIARQAEQGRTLGWDGLTFQVSEIIAYQPAAPPDLVLALHACDTATDEALAQAVRWQSRMIYSAPCCHHDLQRQMSQQALPPQVRPLARHGILKERLGDILTDGFRALILRMLGYRTDVIAFVSTEHTDKNLMIRAIKAGKPGNPQAMREYEGLVRFWQVKPYLAQLLEEELSAISGERSSVSGQQSELAS